MLSPTGLGIFNVDPLPSDLDIDMGMVTQLTEASSASENNPIGGITASPKISEILFGLLTNAIFIVPILTKLGIPLAISTPLNIILILLYVIDLALYIRGLQQ